MTSSRIIASAPVGVVFADRDGVIRIWNEAAAKLLGYPPDQTSGSRLDLFIPPEHRDQAPRCGSPATKRGRLASSSQVSGL